MNSIDSLVNPDKLEFIRSHISQAALYEQLAEECTELAQAALKKARKIRDENYTPLSMSVIDDDLLEEYNDVILIANGIFVFDPNRKLLNYKLNRWVDRTYAKKCSDV